MIDSALPDPALVVFHQERWQRVLGGLYVVFGIIFVVMGISLLGQPGGGVSGLVVCDLFGISVVAGGLNFITCFVRVNATEVETRYFFRTRRFVWGAIESVAVMRPNAMFGVNVVVALRVSTEPKPVPLRCLWNFSSQVGRATLERHAAAIRAVRPPVEQPLP
jgi:hypothetical protein